MLKFIAISILYFLINGCQMQILSDEDRLYFEKINCKSTTIWTNWQNTGREGCIRGLNTDYKWSFYTKQQCQQILAEWKTAWTRLDRKVIEPENVYPAWMTQENEKLKTISKSKAENKPLPENFKTTEEIFREYPNPCQDSSTFGKEVREYEKIEKEKEKLKQQRNATKN